MKLTFTALLLAVVGLAQTNLSTPASLLPNAPHTLSGVFQIYDNNKVNMQVLRYEGLTFDVDHSFNIGTAAKRAGIIEAQLVLTRTAASGNVLCSMGSGLLDCFNNSSQETFSVTATTGDTNLYRGGVLSTYTAASLLGSSLGPVNGLDLYNTAGTFATGFKAPAALAANVKYTLPLVDGSSGDVMTTNGSKVLSWTTPVYPPFIDTQTIIKGSADATKLLRFEVDGFTTGTTRVITPPNADITVAGINITQTFSLSQTFASDLLANGNPSIGDGTHRFYEGNFNEFVKFYNTSAAGSPSWLVGSSAGNLLQFYDSGSNLRMYLDASGSQPLGTGVFLAATSMSGLFEASNNSTPTLTVVANGSQTADLFRAYNTSSALKLYITAAGVLNATDVNISGTCTGCGGSGTVTSVTVTGANGIGVSGCVITTSGTCALSLGAITPSSISTSGSISGSAFNFNGSLGTTATITVRKGGGASDCTIIFSVGGYISTTC